MFSHPAWKIAFPYLRTSGAVATAMSVGDFACQHLGDQPYNPKRTLRMAITGAFVSGPIGHTWMRVLEHYVPGNSVRRSLQKVVCNAFFSPVQIAASFTSITLLEGKAPRDAKEKIKADLANTMLIGACYWPFIGFLQFRYVPVDYRAITGSIAGAVWNTFLSAQAHRPVAAASPPDADTHLTTPVSSPSSAAGGNVSPASKVSPQPAL